MSAAEKLRKNGINISMDMLGAIARKYEVTEIDVFGSSIRADMQAKSDVDLLVSFAPHAKVSLFDIMDLETELEQLFSRVVDIVEPQALTNPIRRKSILSSREPLYAA